MQLPNKLYSYNKSTLYYLPKTLEIIKNGTNNVKDIYEQIKFELDDPTDFLSVMDCLYALHKIEMDSDGRVNLC